MTFKPTPCATNAFHKSQLDQIAEAEFDCRAEPRQPRLPRRTGMDALAVSPTKRVTTQPAGYIAGAGPQETSGLGNRIEADTERDDFGFAKQLPHGGRIHRRKAAAKRIDRPPPFSPAAVVLT
jgi:hypothetical protein